ncbi:MAG: ATP-binding protein [Clostridiales bacterium]|nr:ATP-binding protein [Eubacteriales bacterium]MDH7565041.1 ATP-binding protein [Clostridiales bacterium]
MTWEQDQFIVWWYLLAEYLMKENMRLQGELERLVHELAETDHGVMALMIENLQKKNEEQKEKIIEQEKALLQAEKLASLGLLVAGVAHEINNPTTYIRANIELLQKYWKRIAEKIGSVDSEGINAYTADFEKVLESMYKGTDRIIDIVRGLKIFARQEKATYEVFDLNGCITEAYKLVKNEFVENKINYLNRTEKERFFIHGSRQQMEQVFVNLLLNSITAVKASKFQGDGLVEIRVKSAGDDRLLITVKDNGCGIAEKNMNKIFSPFFTTNQASGGTGLGLSIVYGIIKDHGGNIEVRSEGNQGTEFMITLPEHHKA